MIRNLVLWLFIANNHKGIDHFSPINAKEKRKDTLCKSKRLWILVIMVSFCAWCKTVNGVFLVFKDCNKDKVQILCQKGIVNSYFIPS